MKIKILKAVVSCDPKDKNKSFKYLPNDVIRIKGSSKDLFDLDLTTFFDQHGFVFDLNKNDYVVI